MRRLLYLMAGEQGFEPWYAGIKIQCLNQLGDSPTQPFVAVICRYFSGNSRLTKLLSAFAELFATLFDDEVSQRVAIERFCLPRCPAMRNLFEHFVN